MLNYTLHRHRRIRGEVDNEDSGSQQGKVSVTEVVISSYIKLVVYKFNFNRNFIIFILIFYILQLYDNSILYMLI